jgi:hypothetical protein
MSLDRIWIRDSNGNPIELDSLWIRNQGAARKIGEVWVRNSSGVAEKAYPNASEENDGETELIFNNQGASQQMCSLRFDQVFGGSWSTGIEEAYRNFGVKFAMNTGVGSEGGSGTLYSAAQNAFNNLGIIDAWNNQESINPTTPFNWDWGVSINIENGTSVRAILLGGADETEVVPLDYHYFDRSGTIDAQIQQVINTVQYYYPSATTETITYQQLHNACKQANIDTANWLRTQVQGAKIMNWWKTAANPCPLILGGHFNNNDVLLPLIDGRPPEGVDALNKKASSGKRTILGDNQYSVVNGTEVRLTTPTSWSWGMDSYPVGSYQARANAVPFEYCANSSGIEEGLDCLVHQSYFPVYPIERTLDTIPSELTGFTVIEVNDLTGGFENSGSRYTRYSEAMQAVAQVTRNNWLANWKYFGSKAAIGTELCFDYGGIVENRFGGLAMDRFDYRDAVVLPILAKLTEEEAVLFGFPKDLIGKRLFPRYWVYWTADYYTLSQFVRDENGYEGRGNFRHPTDYSIIIPVLARARLNIEWRFRDRNPPEVDWQEGSDYHGFVCQQLDVDGLQRVEITKMEIDNARLDP